MSVLFAMAMAWADLPPPPGYVETCTVELQCQAGEEGTACGAWFGEPDACAPLLAQGWTLRCRTAGASTWTEVYCRSSAGGGRGAAAQAAGGGATGGAACGGASGPALLVGLGGWAAWALRRRPGGEGEAEEERRAA